MRTGLGLWNTPKNEYTKEKGMTRMKELYHRKDTYQESYVQDRSFPNQE